MSDNPYESPEDVPKAVAKKPGKQKQPFSHQAAAFSALAPFILIVMNIFIRAATQEQQGTETGAQIGLTISVLATLMILAGIVFGFVGLIGGWMRGAGMTIVLAVIGLVLNIGIIVLTANVFL